MPRDGAVRHAQRLPDLTGRARTSEERRELTVGGNPTTGNSSHQLEHGPSKGHAEAAPVCSS